MSEWQVGDLALCVGVDPHSEEQASGWSVKVGQVVTVAVVEAAIDENGFWTSLNFAEEPSHELWNDWGFDAAFFRKVTPHEADEFDRETIELMNRAPAKEPVA